MDSSGQGGTPKDAIGSQLESRWAEWGSTGSLDFYLHARGHYVYVAWGSDESRPLYIGKSSNVLARLGQHSTVQPWYPDAVRFELHTFESSKAAEDAETEAIYELNPIYNRQRLPTKAQLLDIQRRKADREARLAVVAAEWAAKRLRAANPKPARLPRVQSPWPRKRLRPARPGWPDYFTEEQFAIIRRVQNRGRAA